MTPEERGMLEETYRLAQENNEVLKSIQRASKTALALKIAYWVIVIALSFGAYYLIQPYVDTLKASVSDITGSSTLGGL